MAMNTLGRPKDVGKDNPLKCIRAEGPADDSTKGKALENGISHGNSLSVQRANNSPRPGPLCGDRLGLWPEIRWRGRCLIQGCALRWANFWAFGPNIKQANSLTRRMGFSPSTPNLDGLNMSASPAFSAISRRREANLSYSSCARVIRNARPGRILQPLVIENKPLDEKLTEPSGRPLPKLRPPQAADAVTNG